MTDSMKFGPEWLRNMSADSTISNSINSSNPFTNSSAVGFGGGGSIMAHSNNNNNSNTSLTASNTNINANSLHNSVNMSSSGASRNTFPEFRYGREEMLLLFDRNCNIPEIMPSYKHLFIEKVQFPIALVPSTDEEMIMQGSVPPTQRPAWLQRSPVGFSSSTRGIGRGGSMERGRMRGKSVYHPVFQRPNAMFEEDIRPTTIKADRSWAERNGGAGGDAVASAGSSTVGCSVSDVWNGNTPSSSPRREFSNHPRNMENWRRSRNENGSGDGSATTTFSADGGWRMNSSGLQNTHTRWGRSTSWRDDELANNNETQGIGTSASDTPFTAGSMLMQRSYSTISTSHGERLGHQNASKQATGHPSGGSGGGPTRSISMTSSGTRQSVCRNIWPNNVQTNTMPTNNQGECANDDIALPEWAMENPSDVGGTFDASGAFRGTLDGDDEDDDNHNHQRSTLRSETLQDNVADKDESGLSEAEHHQKSLKTSEDFLNKSSDEIFKNTSMGNTEICMNSSSTSPPSSSAITLDHENSNDNFGEFGMSLQENVSDLKESLTTETIQENVSQIVNNHLEHNDASKDESTGENVKIYLDIATLSNNNTGDYAERMMRVADDMIEKLIMDDEDAKDEHMKSPSLMTAVGNKLNAQHAFVNALQLQKEQNSNLQTVSPAQAVSAGPAGPPNISMPSLYNMAGMIGDHTHNMASLHQLQQQQLAAVAIGLQPPPHALASTSAADLWLYRDPQAKVQGPFSAVEMTEWYRAGYFNENLFVRRVCDSRYRPLGELIKMCNGQMPFNHSHLIPIDLSPSPLTPPLQQNMSSVQPIAQTTDFIIKTLSEHQQHQQHEELKGNVTAAADSLNNALKTLINSVDMSQVLNIHFQTLQERFIRNQEMEIINELAKNECFQRLAAAEQDSVVRQKLQMMVLPEYLTNLTGLSNSLGALNPVAQTQLYETIAECSKKEKLYASNQQQPTQSQQQRSNHHNTSSTAYANAEDFIIKNSKPGNHDLGNNDLLNEFNLRMFLNSSDMTAAAGVVTSNSHANEFLNQQQLFGATGATTSNPLTNNTGQSPMMKMWMTQITGNQSNLHQQVQPQQQLMTGPQHGVNDQWLNGPLVAIPAIGIAREQLISADGVEGVIGSSKPIPTSMWDVAALEQHVQVQQRHVHQKQQDQQQLQQQLQQQQLHQEQHQNFDHNRHINETIENSQQQHDVNKQNNRHQIESKHEQHQQMQQKTNESQKQTDSKFSSSDVINKQELQQCHQSQQQSSNEKLASQLININNKRNCNTNTVKQTTKPPTKDDNDVANPINNNKKGEDERRREQNEEKRRQKEERKRQQIEEEKRRHLQAEEEKRRQLQEEEKRQQQIQAQRRKALMSISNNNSPNNDIGLLQPNPTFSHLAGNNAGNKPNNNKDQQRIQASVAPWSSQTMSAAKSQGPSLAEIQKAERRERRADQQRQLEMHEKQMRALAATAEAQDPVIKWNAAPVPVKSFAEIQAEEAKRLAHEQMESQRRKEQEASTILVNFSSGVATTPGSGIIYTSNMSSIWSGTKIWGATANTTGFWEEPLKFNNKTQSGRGAASSSNVNNNNNVTSPFMQSKLSPLQQNSTQQPSASNKNIKKSQSVTVMQNAVSITPSTSGMVSGSNQKRAINSTTIIAKQNKPQKPEDTYSVADNKKLVAKNNNTNKCDDYEAEFINWCTKSLNNMNAKVDVPTFVSFLRDLESPYEVKDYIRMYLGESKEYIDFAKQFLERRSKYKNLQRAQNAHNDDLCKPAQAITPSANDNSENKSKQRKIKKNKMTKLDARILGFSVTAAEGRINVGDRDYVDAP